MTDTKRDAEPSPADKFIQYAKGFFAVPKEELAEVMARNDAPKLKPGRKAKPKPATK
jgi:hypothetical protein